MPANRNTLLRYKTIDRCLRDHSRLWTLEDLKLACGDAITQSKGTSKIIEVGDRTIQGDIRNMRYSEELGYFAPIIVTYNKYYSYEDKDYSITKVPLGERDLSQLSEAINVLKQLSSFAAFDSVEDVVNKLEDHVLSMRLQTEPVIHLETNSRLRGLHYISTLHEAIVNKRPVQVTYCPFGEENHYLIFSPYVLKEYRNRWFVIGGKKVEGCIANPPIRHLALDRIENLEILFSENYLPTKGFNAVEYFKDIVGASKFDSPVETVTFMVDSFQTPYVMTKPIHHSQEVINKDERTGWTTFQIKVMINPELIREMMGVASHIRILSPESLVQDIKNQIQKASSLYE